MSTEGPERPPEGRWEQPAGDPEPAGTGQVPGPPTEPVRPGAWQPAPTEPAPPPPQPPYTSGPPPLWGYAPPSHYGQARTPPPHNAQNEGTAIAVLVLSVASFMAFGIGVVLAIVALALYPSAKRKIEASGGALTGESLLTAGRIIAWVNVGLVALLAVGVVVAIILGAVFSEPDEFDTVMALASALP